MDLWQLINNATSGITGVCTNTCIMSVLFFFNLYASNPSIPPPPNSQHRHPIPPVNTAGMGLWCKSGPWMPSLWPVPFSLLHIKCPRASSSAECCYWKGQLTGSFCISNQSREIQKYKANLYTLENLSVSWNQKEFPFNFLFKFLINCKFGPWRSSINLNLIAKTFQAFCLLEIKLIKKN